MKTASVPMLRRATRNGQTSQNLIIQLSLGANDSINVRFTIFVHCDPSSPHPEDWGVARGVGFSSKEKSYEIGLL